MIGIFDSGLGGLTVAARLLPGWSLHYFADTAHVPYGDRSPAQVRRLANRIVAYLVERGASAVVMACNTATALAREEIQRWCPVPLVGIIAPAARAAVARSRTGRVGVIANPLTAASGAYQQAMPELEVRSVGCAELVALIEKGEVASPWTRQCLFGYLDELGEVDTVVLGCTHFPFLTPLVREYYGPDVEIIDPGSFVTSELRARGLRPELYPRHLFEVSGSPEHFREVGSRLLGRPLPPVTSVRLWTPQQIGA